MITLHAVDHSLRRRTIAAVYLSGLLVGISLILFPSAGPLLTSAEFHALNSGQFGVLFTPQIITAILASSLTAALANRVGMKRVMGIGLLLAALAMLVLAGSHLLIGTGGVFPALLLATGAMGAGFGLTISALNAYAFDLFPRQEDSAVTAIHVLTGTGQVGAALLLRFFTGLGTWYAAPLVIAVMIGAMLAFQWRLPLRLRSEDQPTQPNTQRSRSRLPLRVGLFALATFTYGALEGTFGNWTPIYLETAAELSVAEAAAGLSLFWAAVTGGRVLFALAAARLNVRPLFFVTPFVVGATLLILPTLNGTTAHYAALIVAGLALSYFFPYSISLASAESPALTALISGALVAGLQLGSGLSATVVGAASASTSLAIIFQLSAGYAAVMAAVVIYLGISAARRTRLTMNTDLPCLALPCVQTQTRGEVIG